jgi:aryl-alcohol dehydrogenase-like predicted oxidoreductase
MLYRKLGNTDLEAPVMGLGCAALGGSYGPVTEELAARTIYKAFDLGIHYLDTAPLYGKTQSETNVGKALRGIARDRYLIESKVGRYDYADHDFSYARVKQGLEATLGRLGCEYLDICILHDIEFVPIEQVVNEGLRAVHDARAEGKVRFVGASGLPLAIFPAILSHASLDLVLSYANYTLQNTALEAMLPDFETRGLGVVHASPLALGLLTPKGPQPWHLGSDALKAKCREAAEWCAARGIDIAEVGMQFAMANPRIHSTLTGAATPEEVERNARCAGRAPDPEIVAQIQAILAPVRNQLWPTGRPEYNR